MTFTFDAAKARKRTPTPANPAKAANPEPSISKISEISSDATADPHGCGYSQADLQEMDRLLRQLAELEGWTPAELQEMLDQRRRMAPARVSEALKQLQDANDAAIAPWPDAPRQRAKVFLCVITGGKQ